MFSPVIPASPLVIPAQAGILTRGAISKGSTIVANYAEKSFKVSIFFCVCMSCSLWCGSGRCAAQDVHILIKIPAFAGMTGGAGILTRDAIYKGSAIAANYAEKSFEVRIISCLYGLKALVWIRAVCKSRRPYPD